MTDRQLEALLAQIAAATNTGAGMSTFLPSILQSAPVALQAPLRRALTGALPLSAALGGAQVINAAERALLEAGERSGTVVATLEALAAAIAERRKARWSLVAGLAYPAMLIVLAGFLLTAPLAVTRGVGAWLAVAIWPFVVVAGAGVVTFVVWPRLPPDHTLRALPARVAMSIPLVGQGIVRTGLGGFCSLLSRLVAAGLPYTLALPAAMRAWPPMAAHQRTVMATLAGGSTLTEALRASGIMPQRVLGPLSTAEMSGTVDTTLDALGREEVAAGRRLSRGLIGAMGLLAFLIVAVAIGATIVQGAQSYFDQIDQAIDGS